jgi:hypothetical protein
MSKDQTLIEADHRDYRESLMDIIGKETSREMYEDVGKLIAKHIREKLNEDGWTHVRTRHDLNRAG